MLRMTGRHGHCFIDPKKVVAIEAWHVDNNGPYTRIVFKGGGRVIVSGEVDDVSFNIDQRKDKP